MYKRQASIARAPGITQSPPRGVGTLAENSWSIFDFTQLKPTDTWPRDRCGRAQLVLLPSLADSLHLDTTLGGLYSHALLQGHDLVLLVLQLRSRDTGGKCALAALLLAPRASATCAPRRMRAVALRAQRPMKVIPFGRSPWSQNRFPRNFVPPPSGDGHVDTRRPTWLVHWLRRS